MQNILGIQVICSGRLRSAVPWRSVPSPLSLGVNKQTEWGKKSYSIWFVWARYLCRLPFVPHSLPYVNNIDRAHINNIIYDIVFVCKYFSIIYLYDNVITIPHTDCTNIIYTFSEYICCSVLVYKWIFCSAILVRTKAKWIIFSIYWKKACEQNGRSNMAQQQP